MALPSLRACAVALRGIALACAVLVGARAAGAQTVGYPPTNSPYRDLDYRQELTLLAGQFNAARDPLGVAPQSGPLVGVRYAVRLGGPAEFTARAARVFSNRLIVDPRLTAATRERGEQSWPLYLSDIGIAVNLTGQKTLRGFMPVVQAGLGIASDFKGKADFESSTYGGGYKFGTSFALSGGLGVRYAPGGSFQLRADVTDWLYQIKYPSSFSVPPAGGAAVLPVGQSASLWKHNAAFTLGASYLFFR